MASFGNEIIKTIRWFILLKMYMLLTCDHSSKWRDRATKRSYKWILWTGWWTAYRDLRSLTKQCISFNIRQIMACRPNIGSLYTVKWTEKKSDTSYELKFRGEIMRNVFIVFWKWWWIDKMDLLIMWFCLRNCVTQFVCQSVMLLLNLYAYHAKFPCDDESKSVRWMK